MSRKKLHRFIVIRNKTHRRYKRITNRSDCLNYGHCRYFDHDSMATMWFKLQYNSVDNPKVVITNLKRAIKHPKLSNKGRYEGAFRVTDVIGLTVPGPSNIGILYAVNAQRRLEKALGNTVAYEVSPAELYNIQKDALNW